MGKRRGKRRGKKFVGGDAGVEGKKVWEREGAV